MQKCSKQIQNYSLPQEICKRQEKEDLLQNQIASLQEQGKANRDAHQAEIQQMNEKQHALERQMDEKEKNWRDKWMRKKKPRREKWMGKKKN